MGIAFCRSYILRVNLSPSLSLSLSLSLEKGEFNTTRGGFKGNEAALNIASNLMKRQVSWTI